MEAVAAPYSAHYSVEDVTALAEVLRGLPEFSRGDAAPDTEELIWMAPQYRGNGSSARQVATLRLSKGALRIECQSLKALHALQVLVERLGGGSALLVSTQRPATGL